MEIWDVYDRNRVKTGKTISREDFMRLGNELLSDGEYRIIVNICIFNSKGQMLVQQRQPFKHGWSGFWDITAGGNSIAGDTSQMAASRELFEEVGITVDFADTLPHFTVNSLRAFFDFYLVEKEVDIDSLQLQYEEVAQVKWADKDEVLKMMRDGSFVPYQDGIIDLCFALVKRRRTLAYDE